MKSDWVKCPICGQPDMESKPDGDEGHRIISCTNLNCGSNGGTNFDGLPVSAPEPVAPVTREVSEADAILMKICDKIITEYWMAAATGTCHPPLESSSAVRLAQALKRRLTVVVEPIPVNMPICQHGKGFLQRCPECEAAARWNKGEQMPAEPPHDLEAEIAVLDVLLKCCAHKFIDSRFGGAAGCTLSVCQCSNQTAALLQAFPALAAPTLQAESSHHVADRNLVGDGTGVGQTYCPPVGAAQGWRETLGFGVVEVRDGVNVSHDAYHNLGGAIIDLERSAMTEGGYYCDDVCLRTLKRVEQQLGAASLIPSPPKDPA